MRAILTISSDGFSNCPVCRAYTLDGIDHFDAAVNHMLDHGWGLLHLGSQDLTEADGGAYRTTIAVLTHRPGTPRRAPLGCGPRRGYLSGASKVTLMLLIASAAAVF